MESKLYCPSVLEAECAQLHACSSVNLRGYYQAPLGSLKNTTEALTIMKQFTDGVNLSRMDDLINFNSKQGAELKDYKFLLSDPWGGDNNLIPQHEALRNGGGSFFCDGQYSVSLGINHKELGKIWLAILGMSALSSLKTGKLSLSEPTAPIIVQLQTAYHSDAHKQLAGELLQTIRWEFILVTLAVEWASNCGMSRIFLLPAEQNKYYRSYGSDQQMRNRFKLRYNVTGQRCGFKLDPKLGVYALDLSDVKQDTNN